MNIELFPYQKDILIFKQYKMPPCKSCGQFQSFKKTHHCPVTGLPNGNLIGTVIKLMKKNLNEKISNEMSPVREIYKDEPIGICEKVNLLPDGSQSDTVEVRLFMGPTV